MHILGRIYQMVEQKDMTTPFFFFFFNKNTKITTNCWTTINKKVLEPTQKIPYIQRQKEATTRQWEGHNHSNIKSYTYQVANPQIGKQLYHRWRRKWQPTPVFLWVEEPGGLLSIGLHRVGHNWSNLAYITEVLPQEWKFQAPCQAPQPRSLATGREAPRESGFEGQKLQT